MMEIKLQADKTLVLFKKMAKFPVCFKNSRLKSAFTSQGKRMQKV